MSTALLAHPGYCLVWLGVEEKEGTDLLPVAAEGSTTMSGKECKECMAVLLSAAEEHDGGQDQALAALRSGGPVVRRNILAGVEKGSLKNTPLAEGEVSCAAVPLGSGDEVLGVVSIYSLAPESFERAEVELLLLLARLAAARLKAMASKRHLIARLPASEGGAGNLGLEINNMCNGIINYAQLLTDELGHSMAAEQNLLLANIIKEGERIAALVGPLVGEQRETAVAGKDL
jgi:GAF domain-containing protein